MRGGTRPDAPDVPALHIVTDDTVLARPGFARSARTLIEDGGPRVAVHLRGPDSGGRFLYALANELVPIAQESGAWLVINDRVDVAMAAQADLVHLGARSMSITDSRALLGPAARVGASTHTPSETDAAVRMGADWVFAGTVYETPTHPGRRGAGREGLAAIVTVAEGVPVFAIGGVTPGRIPEILEAGATGAAVIRGVWNATRPAEALYEYLDALAVRAGEEPGDT
jgi:thiamine-phosphate pyrophosphorylase